LKICDLKLGCPRAFDHIIVSVQQIAELEVVRALNIGNQQCARAVLLRDVNRNAEIHSGMLYAVGRLVLLFE